MEHNAAASTVVVPHGRCAAELRPTEPVTSHLELLRSERVVRICAPMVRYSKLPFRALVRKYGCDVAYTPMIVSDSFVQSSKARDVEFTTNREDRPLIVQFAATNSADFARAAELVAPFSDGVDLNCGCPQRWALAEGYGAALIKNPDLVADIVRTARRRTPLPISIKIRIHSDLRQTVELCRRAESVGCGWITVHGRTTKQRAEPCNFNAIKIVKESVSVPVVANGDIRNEEDIHRIYEMTGVDGVMAARGVLENPAMFSGVPTTPLSVVQDWVHLSLTHGLPHSLFHRPLIHMLERVHSRVEKREFNTLPSTPAVLDYLRNHYGIT